MSFFLCQMLCLDAAFLRVDCVISSTTTEEDVGACHDALTSSQSLTLSSGESSWGYCPGPFQIFSVRICKANTEKPHERPTRPTFTAKHFSFEERPTIFSPLRNRTKKGRVQDADMQCVRVFVCVWRGGFIWGNKWTYVFNIKSVLTPVFNWMLSHLASTHCPPEGKICYFCHSLNLSGTLLLLQGQSNFAVDAKFSMHLHTMCPPFIMQFTFPQFYISEQTCRFLCPIYRDVANIHT